MQELNRAKPVAEVETMAIELPMPSAEIVPVEQASPEEAQQIERLIGDLDMSDTQSIISFGSAAQSELQAISSAMLDGVRNKDVGPAGKSLRDIVLNIRGFDVDELDPTKSPASLPGFSARPAPSPISSPNMRACAARLMPSRMNCWPMKACC